MNFIFLDASVVERHQVIRFGDLLKLQDCGLISVVPFLEKMFSGKGFKKLMLPYQADVLLITADDGIRAKLTVPQFPLTAAGRQLYGVVQCTVQMAYLHDFANFLHLEGCQLTLLHGARMSPGGNLEYVSSTPIEPRPIQPGNVSPMKDKRLIEVAFPLKQTSLDSVHEKNVRHGHISTLHIWPARRPLAASRAALIATLLPDPGDAEKRKAILERMAGRVSEKTEQRRVNERQIEKVKEETVGGILHWGREDGPQSAVVPRRDSQGLRGACAQGAGPVCGGRRDSA